jgi:hypothetical protein
VAEPAMNGWKVLGSVPNLLLIELFLKWIKWLEAHTNIVETLPLVFR